MNLLVGLSLDLLKIQASILACYITEVVNDAHATESCMICKLIYTERELPKECKNGDNGLLV